MRHVAANAMSVLIVLGLALAGVIVYGQGAMTDAGPHERAVTVVLKRGDGLTRVSEVLSEAGVIDKPVLFRLGARYRGVSTALKFGEYSIPAGASMTSVMDILVDGATIQHKFTVVEGTTSHSVIEILRSVDVLTGEIETMPPEGAIAADTYFVQRGETRQAVVDRMMAAQQQILMEAWEGRVADLPVRSPEEVLVLASIVEKETGLAEERPRVASVFINRLRKGMKLQSDPTVIYGVTNGEQALDRPIRRSDLNNDNPFNTYKIPGLPPTPIANPGRAAILAVTQPDVTDDLYFVADGTGGHAFAKTLPEHNANVRKWREIERSRANE